MSHSTLENQSKSVNISVSNKTSIPSRSNLDWARKAAVLNNKWGAEYFKFNSTDFIKTPLYNVNITWLESMTNRISQGSGLWGIGKLNWGLFDGCVQHSSYALWGVGIPTLPINVAPIILNIQLTIRQAGIFISPYLVTY